MSSVSSNKLLSIVGESSNNAASILINELSVVLNQDLGSVTITETVENVDVEANETNLNINTVGDTVFSGKVEATWVDYVLGYSSEPTLTQTIAAGDVYTYTYPNTVLYRLVPSGLEQDAFYSAFSGGVLSVLVATKGMTV